METEILQTEYHYRDWQSNRINTLDNILTRNFLIDENRNLRKTEYYYNKMENSDTTTKSPLPEIDRALEDWHEARTDLVPRTMKVYSAYIKGFRKHFKGDPKTSQPVDVWKALDKMSLSTKTKMLNILSKYTENHIDYGSKIRALNVEAEKEQIKNKPHFTNTPDELRKKICSTPLEDYVRVIYLLMIDHPALRLTDYHSLLIGEPSEPSKHNWIDIYWENIHWNKLCKSSTTTKMATKLDSSFKVYRELFNGKTRLVEKSLDALVMTFVKTNKILGLKRGASMFRSLQYDQMTDDQITSIRDNIELAQKHNHTLGIAALRYMRPPKDDDDIPDLR